MQVLFAERPGGTVEMARGLHVGSRRAFTQHLQNGIAGYQVNEKKDDGDDEPDGGQRVQHAKREVAQHSISQEDNLIIEAEGSAPKKDARIARKAAGAKFSL